ncbi:alkylated DNA repair protein (DNA oxidative demethylase) [Phenylobacterium haematophilum]|uniref:Alkylated DNA repair protein (DNA oxidative demethylase) n=1 Tax=Phenylobacterium haematophilum TaxID=98513 RepID=A0A840A183_9CAUL|nr:alpha-ketoglutarate-dependent dioxygenase AlkB [Phenylobacterium haematophilum]MBB3892685.1 alkylated DNA repair protein (DNA oxidative demethylase) [Phenylobacterium haematophilum]
MSLSTTSGFRLLPGRLSPAAQAALLEEVAAGLADAPLVRQATPGGKLMSVAMSSFGDLGWTTDAKGYRYEPRHPITGRFWPQIPTILTDLWRELADPEVPPDACLINFYDADAKMGLHQDKDEADFRFPVLSVSLGDTAVFRIGGLKRSDPTTSVRLSSGDVCLLAGEARLYHHGIDRILPGSSRLIPGGGRINLTLRRAAAA